MCTVTLAPGDVGDTGDVGEAGEAGEAGDTGGRGGRGAAAGVRNCCSVATGVGEGRQLEARYLGKSERWSPRMWKSSTDPRK